MSYQPREGSLAHRLCAFFTANPEEELSCADIAQKYDVHAKQVPALLSSALGGGFIVRAKQGIYKGGPKLETQAGAPPPQTSGFKGWLARQGLEEGKGGGAGAALPAPESLVIEDGVPIPQPMSEQMLRFAGVFGQMTCGQSFKCDQAVSKALISAANRWGKSQGRRFIVRRVTETTARIWRKE
jgi:hypothetical protein